MINFDCSSNQLSSLDVSNNTLLKKLNCYDNAFTTQALDDIYCQLPNRNDSTHMGVIKPIYDYESKNAYIVDATNAANATAKNWRVQYYNKDNTEFFRRPRGRLKKKGAAFSLLPLQSMHNK